MHCHLVEIERRGGPLKRHKMTIKDAGCRSFLRTKYWNASLISGLSSTSSSFDRFPHFRKEGERDQRRGQRAEGKGQK